MSSDGFPPRVAAVIAFLAIFPVVGYVLIRPSTIAAVAAVNVVLISVSLYLLMSPAEGGPHGEPEAA